MRYVIAHVINSPAGGVRTARLVISDVPDRTTVDEVIKALEAAGKAGEFSEAGVPFGNHEIKAEGRRGWPQGIAGIDGAPSVAWSRLITPPTANEGRRVTLRLTPAEYDRYALAATRAGESLQSWFVGAAEARAGAEGKLREAAGIAGRQAAADIARTSSASAAVSRAQAAAGAR